MEDKITGIMCFFIPEVSKTSDYNKKTGFESQVQH